jgi:pimeloyl-ACP methyl ester carboxylesterase
VNDLLSDLRQWVRDLAGSPRPSPPAKALVFVHGIFSNHATFETLVTGLLRADPSLKAWGMYFFDYDFNQPILASGLQLAQILRAAFPEANSEITLVGHSMGGLVARTALLQEGDMGMVKRLVMLGTPNHGTLQTARMGVLAHMLRESTAVLWTVFAREATGIKDLTQIGKTLDPLINSNCVERTRNVEYVTIPGLRFNEEAGWLESPQKTSAGLRALSVLFGIMKAIPGMNTELQLPHDGIVEERCVRLSGEPDHISERPATGQGKTPFAPYLHIIHRDYKSVDHVTVQKADRTIALLAELLRSPDLEDWRTTLSRRGEFNLYP